MRLCVISFTETGRQLSEKLAEAWENAARKCATQTCALQECAMQNERMREDAAQECVTQGGILHGEAAQKDMAWNRADAILISLFTKHAREFSGEESAFYPVQTVSQSVAGWAGAQMREGAALLFIGACGIAVRAVAPHLRDKLRDSPVLVMDELGTYVIPLLSGHVGGANELARRIAQLTGALPVITTATDLHHRFAVDLFAKRNQLTIRNREGIAKVSSRILAGRTVTLSVQPGHLREDEELPAGVIAVPYPPEQFVDIVVTDEERAFDAALLLSPREYVIGMGCRRGKETEKIEELIRRTLERSGIRPEQVLALASIDRKRAEPGLLAWSRSRRVPFLTFPAEQLAGVKGCIRGSEFVRSTVGVDNVCERAALLVCGPGGRLILEKYAEDGMTIAVARREWSVTFDEEYDPDRGDRTGR